MSLLTVRSLHLSFGVESLFQDASFSVEAKERACIIGRNGAGKSTLFKILLGEVQPDRGEIEKTDGLTISMLVQDVPRDLKGTAFDNVIEGLGDQAKQLQRYLELSQNLNENNMAAFQRLQERLDQDNAWGLKQKAESVLSQVGISPDAKMSTLSGGQIRRVLMAKAIVNNPDILLLDEPTNHLDIENIIWLENFLLNFKKTIIFITHDRALLNKIATRIIEVDFGRIISWKGNYNDYLIHKAEALAEEEKHNAHFDKKLAEEEKWIRQGIKARRTRNEGRVRKLKAMREQFLQRRNRVGELQFKSQAVAESGKIIFDAEHLSYQSLIKDFSVTVMRGDKIGIIGPNGCGKSTLLKLILNEIEPESGKIKSGTGLEVAYFDQQRLQLDLEKTVVDNVFEGADFIDIDNKKIHVLSYLRDFLFTPERARVQTKVLSGGERHRLLLARLFTKPCNVLILDEPTNDLDQETLELLEDRLTDYKGTVLLVSHDRDFIDNVVTSTWVFEGRGKVAEYVGGYQDYLRQRPMNETQKLMLSTDGKRVKKEQAKLSYKDQRELDALPDKIDAMEASLASLHQHVSDPDFYKKSPDDISIFNQKIKVLEADIEAAYKRWEELSSSSAN